MRVINEPTKGQPHDLGSEREYPCVVLLPRPDPRWISRLTVGKQLKTGRYDAIYDTIH